MQAAANSNLILTDLSSFKRLAGLQKDISHAAFYQQVLSELIRGVYRKQTFTELGDRLVALLRHAYALREIAAVEEASELLLELPLGREYQSIGAYYQALCIYQRGRFAEARILLEQVAGKLPLRFRAKALLATSGTYYQCDDLQSFLLLNVEASRSAACGDLRDLQTFVRSQRNLAVLKSIDGDHRGALADLERLLPLARALGRWQPYSYYEHLNSLAVELMETGRLEEAGNASQIVLASPFAGAYPEWRETREEIELRGCRPSRATVAVGQRTFEANNLVRLPALQHCDNLGAVEQPAAGRPAHVLSYLDWKNKMPKQSNGDPQHKTTPRPTTDKEKQARFFELRKLDTRDLLLRLMETIGDEDISDDQLLRALVILEGLEPDENQGS